MHPPFTTGQFLDVFRRYNEMVWPAQIALNAAGLFAAFAAYRANVRRSWWWGRASVLVLAALWLWCGVAFHKLFFATVTPAGLIFGSLFIAEGALLLLMAWQNGPSFEPVSHASVAAATVLLVYSLAIYPAIGWVLGHRYPFVPSFGTPCPTTVFTFGIFCLLATAVPRFAIAIPVLWSLIGSSAMLDLGMREDAGLLAGAVASLVVIHHEAVRRNASHVSASPPMPMTNSRR